MLNSRKEKVIPLNCKPSKITEEIKLNVGDIIKDKGLSISCTVNDMNETSIEFSHVKYPHPYQLTVFVLNLYNTLKNALGITNVRFKTNLGTFTVDHRNYEKELYNRLMDIEAESF